MILRSFLTIFLFALIHTSFSQKALKSLKYVEKGELSKAFEKLEKAIDKAPNDPANFFSLASIYSLGEYAPDLIDSAHYYIMKADSSYFIMPSKAHRAYIRKGMDSNTILQLHNEIDSIAFSFAKQKNTPNSYNYFLSRYNNAKQYEEAKKLRNSTAYQEALASKTPEALSNFFKSYPSAPQAVEAREVFENLYYQEFTADKNFSSYINYLNERPTTIFSQKAAKAVLDIISTGYDLKTIQDFQEQYGSYEAGAIANDYLNIIALSNKNAPLVAYYKNEKYHLLNIHQQSLIKEKFSDIQFDSCNFLLDPVIRTINKDLSVILNRSLDTLFIGDHSFSKVYGGQWLKVKEPRAYLYHWVHLSGNKRLFFKAYDFMYLNDMHFAEKQQDGWMLKSFTGQTLIASRVDSLYMENGLYFLYNSGRLAILSPEQLGQNALLKTKSLAFLYSDYEFINDSLLWLASDKFETIIDSNLKTRINLIEANINSEGNYFVLEKEGYYEIMDEGFSLLWKGQLSKLKSKGDLLALYRNEKWAVQNLLLDPFPKFKYDSVRLFNSSLAYAIMDGGQYLLFGKEQKPLKLSDDEAFQLLQSPSSLGNDAQENFFIHVRNKKEYQKIYTNNGDLLWEGKAKSIKLLGSKNVFIKTERSAFILDLDDNIVEMKKISAIGNYEDGVLPLFIEEKFGALSIKDLKLTDAISDTKLQPISGDSIFIYSTKGNYGVVRNNTVILKPEYKSILAINGELVLVQKDVEWKLISLSKPEEVMNVFSFVQPLNGSVESKEFLVRKSAGFGVLNEKGEVIIPTIFNELKRIKLQSISFWYAERSIVEIGLYIIAYYDLQGKLLFKEALSEEEYNMSSCEELNN